jgi:hypothetical protein
MVSFVLPLGYYQHCSRRFECKMMIIEISFTRTDQLQLALKCSLSTCGALELGQLVVVDVVCHF